MKPVALIGLGVAVLAGCQAAPIDAASGESASEKSILSLEVGWCLNDVDQPIAQEMTDIPAVPCDQPHQ
jgi:hypothetical protein